MYVLSIFDCTLRSELQALCDIVVEFFLKFVLFTVGYIYCRIVNFQNVNFLFKLSNKLEFLIELHNINELLSKLNFSNTLLFMALDPIIELSFVYLKLR